MRNLLKLFGIIALAVVIGFTLIGCGDGGGGTPPVSDPALTGTVSISGTAEVGQTLTAVTSALGGSGNISYQWKRNPATGAAVNIGTNSGTYQVITADIGATITVTVTRAGYSGSKTGGPTATVALPALTGTVTINGTAELGETLTAVTTALGGNGDISYQWKRNPATGNAVNIGTDSTYQIVEADIGFTITVTVTRDGNSGSVSSQPTATVTDPNAPPLTGTVSITGYAEVGQTLTALTTALGGEGTINFQWKRNPATGNTVNIGENNGTYRVVTADIGATISVTVTRTGNSGSVSSLPTAVIPDPDATGTVNIGISAGGDITIDAPNGLFRDGVLILTRLNNYDEGEVPVVITLANIGDFDEDSIRWRVQNTAEKAGGSVFRLFASNPTYIIGNVYYLTVEAERNGVPYDYTISFMVEEE